MPQQGTDIGTKTPGSVVSAVQADPKSKWLIFDLGDLATGVDAAIKAAGSERTAHRRPDRGHARTSRP